MVTIFIYMNNRLELEILQLQNQMINSLIDHSCEHVEMTSYGRRILDLQ